ncbi:hypothetical protein BX600DRAFT_523392 [Xylariales sp. PMI_506]|nr:hypothetical protein BX600DRAFT_523392 [Xylariales sp. PMI_506]
MIAFAGAIIGLLPGLALGATFQVPDGLSWERSIPESVAVAGGLDQPKLSGIAPDALSYDWWYFDAVSASTNASVVFVFYNGGPLGFINRYHEGPMSVSLTGTYANGKRFSENAAATGGISLNNTEADGISADWVGSGFSFTGSSLNSANPVYTITIDSPSVDVYGTVTFKSRAPAHYPCGPNVEGEVEELMPHVFWANAVPDAEVTVNLTIKGNRIAFTDGVGYHDKNWGDTPFITATSSWYWGHAYLEPYSIVWFDAVDSGGNEHFSGYVAKDGEVIGSSCNPNAVVVRPWGDNSAYPPTLFTGAMQGIEAKFDLGSNGTFIANVTTGLALVDDVLVYIRTLGTVEGGLEGGEQYKGRALFEEFKLNLF